MKKAMFVFALLFSFTACSSPQIMRSNTVISAANQSELTPDQVLARLKTGNARFVAGKSMMHDYKAEIKASSEGQYPMAAIVSCLDSRTSPEIMFDEGIGSFFVGRIAGNTINTEMLGSLEFATKVAGAKLIAVIGHNECGAVKGACDRIQLGNLTATLNEITPAVDKVSALFQGTDKSSKNKDFVQKVADLNAQMAIQEILSKSAIIKELVDQGKVKLVAGMYDIKTGNVVFI